jgi:hypothetical protein
MIKCKKVQKMASLCKYIPGKWQAGKIQKTAKNNVTGEKSIKHSIKFNKKT